MLQQEEFLSFYSDFLSHFPSMSKVMPESINHLTVLICLVFITLQYQLLLIFHTSSIIKVNHSSLHQCFPNLTFHGSLSATEDTEGTSHQNQKLHI